jgi:dTMP kinase
LKGKFVTFEGIDGSGKSTQLRMLQGVLVGRGVDFVTTREPGGTPLGRALRQAFLETEENVAPMAELLAFGADRAQHVEFLIKPALAAGRLVISDRFADATYAYQGAGRRFPPEKVLSVIDLATDGLRPDLTIFFDIEVKMALRRTSDRSSEASNRMDKETGEFYARVRDAYLEIAEKEPERFKVLDASGTPENIHPRVLELIDDLLGGR